MEEFFQELYFFRFVCEDFDQVKVLSYTENLIYPGSSISIDLTPKPLLHAVSFEEDCGGLGGLKPCTIR
jgi:hypothetical protein